MESMSYDYTFHYEIKGVHVYLWRVQLNSEPSACRRAATWTSSMCAQSTGKAEGKKEWQVSAQGGDK